MAGWEPHARAFTAALVSAAQVLARPACCCSTHRTRSAPRSSPPSASTSRSRSSSACPRFAPPFHHTHTAAGRSAPFRHATTPITTSLATCISPAQCRGQAHQAAGETGVASGKAEPVDWRGGALASSPSPAPSHLRLHGRSGTLLARSGSRPSQHPTSVALRVRVCALAPRRSPGSGSAGRFPETRDAPHGRLPRAAPAAARHAAGIMLVYDVTDRESFQAVDTWMAEIAKVRRALAHAMPLCRDAHPPACACAPPTERRPGREQDPSGQQV